MPKSNHDEMQQSIMYRGAILEAMSVLEAMINSYLANFFCGEDKKKRRLMQLLLFGDERITLSNKEQIFDHLASKYDTDWFNAYKSLRPKPKDIKKDFNMHNDLVHVIEQRNNFAHRMMAYDTFDKSHPRRPNTLRLVKLKNDVKPLDYDQKDFEQLRDLIFHLTDYISVTNENKQP